MKTLSVHCAALASEKSKQRIEALEALLSYFTQEDDRGQLYDKFLRDIFNAVASSTKRELALYKGSKGSQKETVSRRLVLCANVIRALLKFGREAWRAKSIPPIVCHIVDTVSSFGQSSSSPITMQYLKALRTVLSHQPHADHLSVDDWNKLVLFCLSYIGSKLSLPLPDLNHLSQDTSLGDAYGNNTEDESNQNDSRHVDFQVIELLQILRILIMSPNGHTSSKVVEVSSLCLALLKHQTRENVAHVSVFGVLSAVLECASLNKVALAQRIAIDVLVPISSMWNTKSSSLKEAILNTMIYASPILLACCQSRQFSIGLRVQLLEDLQAFQTSLTERLDRALLHINDISFIGDTTPKALGAIVFKIRTYLLRDYSSRTEQIWAGVWLYAQNLLCINYLDEVPGPQGNATRPSKRQKTASTFELWIDELDRVSNERKVFMLQVLAFVFSADDTHNLVSQKLVSVLRDLCTNDDTAVASWSMLCVSELVIFNIVSPISSEVLALTNWIEFWKASLSKVNILRCCRASTHLMYVLLISKCVRFVEISKDIAWISESFDLRGPPVLMDSSMRFWSLTLLLEESNVRKPSTLSQQVIEWFFNHLLPRDINDGDNSLEGNVDIDVDILDIIQLLSACCGLLLEPKRPSFDAYELIGKSMFASTEMNELRKYLLKIGPPQPDRTDGYLEQRRLLNTDLNTVRHPREYLKIIDEFRKMEGNFIARLRQVSETPTYSFQQQKLMSDSTKYFVAARYYIYLICKAGKKSTDAFNIPISMLEDSRYILEALSGLIHAQQDDMALCKAVVLSTWPIACDINTLTPCADEEVLLQILGPVSELMNVIWNKISLIREEASLQTKTDDEKESMDWKVLSHSSSSQPTSNRQPQSDTSPRYRTWVTKLFEVKLTLNHCAQQISSQVDWNARAVSSFLDDIAKLGASQILGSSSFVFEFLDRTQSTWTDDQCQRLLRELGTKLLYTYEYERNEDAVILCLKCCSRLLQRWHPDSSSGLSRDLESLLKWFLKIVIILQMTSPASRKEMAPLLLQVLQVNDRYCFEDNSPSIRTLLLALLQDEDNSVRYRYAECVPTIFQNYPGSDHGAIYHDILDCLEAREDNPEGMALRIVTLVNIALSSDYLLKGAVYNICEVAIMPTCTSYVKLGFQQLSTRMKMHNTTHLFKMFEKQMIHSWLRFEKDYKLFPFDVLGFPNRLVWCTECSSELAGQLFLRKMYSSLESLCDLLGMSLRQLKLSSFVEVVSYGLCRKVQRGDSVARVEDWYLLTFERDVYLSTLKSHLGLIVGSMILHTKMTNEMNLHLERRRMVSELNAWNRMHTERRHYEILPEPQQPFFDLLTTLEGLQDLHTQLNMRGSSDWSEATLALILRTILDSNRYSNLKWNPELLLKLKFIYCLAPETCLQMSTLSIVLKELRRLLFVPECSVEAVYLLQYFMSEGYETIRRSPKLAVELTICLTCYVRQLESTIPSNKRSQGVCKITDSSVSGNTELKPWLNDYVCKWIKAAEKTNGKREMYAAALSRVWLSALNSATSSFWQNNLQAISGLSWCSDVSSTHGFDFIIDVSARDMAIELVDSELMAAVDSLAYRKAAELESARGLLKLSKCHKFGRFLKYWLGLIFGQQYFERGVLIGMRFREVERQDFCQQERDSYHFIITGLSSLWNEDDPAIVSASESCIREIGMHVEEKHVRKPIYDIWGDGLFLDKTAVIRSHGPTSDHKSAKPNAGELTELSHSRNGFLHQLIQRICDYRARDQARILAHFRLHPKFPNLFVETVLPAVLHVALLETFSDQQTYQEIINDMSAIFNGVLKQKEARRCGIQKVLIEVILYLRSCAKMNDTNVYERNFWLDIDYHSAAMAALRCGMPNTALLFAEIVEKPLANHLDGEKLTSGDLLNIFKALDDPDTFYGARTEASLASITDKYEHEGKLFESLTLHCGRLQGSSTTTDEIHDQIALQRCLGDLGLDALANSVTLQQNKIDRTAHFRTAWHLQQWDLAVDEIRTDSSIYSVLQRLSINNDVQHNALHFQNTVQSLVDNLNSSDVDAEHWRSILSTLASMEQIKQILNIDIQQRNNYLDLEELQITPSWMTTRSHKHLSGDQEPDTARTIKGKCLSLSAIAKSARTHEDYQRALMATIVLNDLIPVATKYGIDISNAASVELAQVLWAKGDHVSSINLLRAALRHEPSEKTLSLGPSRARIFSILGRWLSLSRDEKPHIILQNYLMKAYESLGKNNNLNDRCLVYHEIAEFCDNQLSDPGNQQDFDDQKLLRDNKKEDMDHLAHLIETESSGNTKQAKELKSAYSKARNVYESDRDEADRISQQRRLFLHLAVKNYLRSISVLDKYKQDVYRLTSLWLGNSDNEVTNETIRKGSASCPTWVFVKLFSQLFPRLENTSSSFQASLSHLLSRASTDHPHHSILHIYPLLHEAEKGKDQQENSRAAAVKKLVSSIGSNHHFARLYNGTTKVCETYNSLASFQISRKTVGVEEIKLSRYPRSASFINEIPRLRVPSLTQSLAARKDCDYSNVPSVVEYEPTLQIAGGISGPKIIKCKTSDGALHRQLVKGGNDDLRQDAIMEQVFGQVSELFQKHFETRTRNLKIRTYKVVPLTKNSGVLEYVQDSISYNDYLVTAHARYHPNDWSHATCRRAIAEARSGSRENQLTAYQSVIRHFQPALRFFLMEKFLDPDDWFASTQSYTRSTAVMSIVGHVLGLGDRHGQNVLLDEKTGEVVHIDLGVSFEQGKVLPIPETVPFRLTRDVIDGFGITGTEGVFRRCCEFTLKLLRDETSSIMTILDVLRHDPLYSWTLSTIRMNRMQRKDELGSTTEGTTRSSRTKAHDKQRVVSQNRHEGEATRALLVVTHKLSKSLSVQAVVNQLIRQASDDNNLAYLFCGWAQWL